MWSILEEDSEFAGVAAHDLQRIVADGRQSVIRRGRAAMELGRRAHGDAEILDMTTKIIRSPDNRKLIVIGTFTVSLFAAAGLAASGNDDAQTLVRKLSTEWNDGEREDFAWLMRESGMAWPGGSVNRKGHNQDLD